MTELTAFQRKIADFFPEISLCFEEPLKNHTSFRIGGPAEVMAFPKNSGELGQLLNKSVLLDCKPVILGAGTNVLAPDEGLRGLVICLKDCLDGLVRVGKVRAIGASAMYGYQFMNMQHIAEQHGWTPFSVMENHYNLLYREDERELIPICKQMQVSLMPYSSLAAGHLARRTWRSDSLRGKTDRVAMGKYDRSEQEDMKIVERVYELSERYGVKMQQIALAWEWAKGVATPIVGATKTKYLDDAVGALAVSLTEEDIAYLEEPYIPHRVVGAILENPPQGVVLLDEKNE